MSTKGYGQCRHYHEEIDAAKASPPIKSGPRRSAGLGPCSFKQPRPHDVSQPPNPTPLLHKQAAERRQAWRPPEPPAPPPL